MENHALADMDLSLLPLVLEALPVGVWIMDVQGTIVYGNPAGRGIWAGAKYVGVERFGEYKGWWADSGKRIEPEEWAAARAIRNGEVSTDERVDIECFDGTRKTILNSALPVRNPEGVVVGAIIVNRDITETSRLEGEKAALITRLEEALARVKTLSGLLPICASCRRIRDGQGPWKSIERVVQERTDAKFSHSICSDCMKMLYPDYSTEA